MTQEFHGHTIFDNETLRVIEETNALQDEIFASFAVPLSMCKADNRTAAKDLHDASMRLLALQLERIR